MTPVDENISDDEFFDCQSDPTRYYAIAYPKDKGQGFVSDNIDEVREKLKRNKLSRLQIFDDSLKAKQFADKPLVDDEKKVKINGSNGAEKKVSGSYPSIKDSELTKLKRAVENGNFEIVKELINSNPRYLITDTDLPTKYSRFRYNILHIAASNGRSDVIQFVLNCLENAEFWTNLYPVPQINDINTNNLNVVLQNHRNTNYRSMMRVLDLYLNLPEPSNLETPLHFASKYGHTECVRALLGHPVTICNLYNKNKKSAKDIVCSRVINLDNEDISTEDRLKFDLVLGVFSEKYVALLDDNCTPISKPLSHVELEKLLGRRKYMFGNDKDEHYTFDSNLVRAYVGPMEKNQAFKLYKRWSVLHAEDAELFEEARKIDGEKGLEIHGRHLAREFDVNWYELWRFLNEFIDFGEDEGLDKFEQYLTREAENRMNFSLCESLMLDEDQKSMNLLTLDESVIEKDELATNFSDNSMFNSLAKLFSRLTLNSSARSTQKSANQSITTDNNNNDSFLANKKPDTFVTSTPLINKTKYRSKKAVYDNSLLLQQVPFDLSVQGNGYLTSDDRHVRRAILQRQNSKIKLTPLEESFPHINHWLNEIDKIDPFSEDVLNCSINQSINKSHFNNTSINNSHRKFYLPPPPTFSTPPRKFRNFATSTPIHKNTNTYKSNNNNSNWVQNLNDSLDIL